MANKIMNIAARHNKLLSWELLVLTAALLTSGQAYSAQSITFYHNDMLGSPIATTDENGNICWREDYQPYGIKLKNDDGYEPPTAGCGLDDNQRGYTGHVHDKDIGLTYMQARYYDPAVGRFMGIDPIGPRLGNQVSFNRYAYGANNPYKYTDPDGRELVSIQMNELSADDPVLRTRDYLVDSEIASDISGFVTEVTNKHSALSVNNTFRLENSSTIKTTNTKAPGLSRHQAGFAIDLNGTSKLKLMN